MLTGKQFKIQKDIPGIEMIDGNPTQITVPEGALIRVVSGPTGGNGLVKVQWGSHHIEMFAVDIEARGTEIRIN